MSLSKLYTLRPATNADQPAVERVVFGVLAEYGLRPDPAVLKLHELYKYYLDAVPLR